MQEQIKELKDSPDSDHILAHCVWDATVFKNVSRMSQQNMNANPETISQTRLGRQERRKNVAGAFVVADGKSVDPNTRYVVIDDVLTTGATLHACALTLRKAGAGLVDAAALAHG
jgi:predicted amidophosphoribosyltransferase